MRPEDGRAQLLKPIEEIPAIADADYVGWKLVVGDSDTRALKSSDSNPFDESGIDPELWSHVEQIVAGDDWANRPLLTAHFVENKIRLRVGEPRGTVKVFGLGLFGSILDVMPAGIISTSV